MDQYGTGQNVPYSGQQDADLMKNPRYTGQSAGTDPLGRDGRGPAEESRYGAVPLSTGTGTNPLPGHGQPGIGGQNTSAVWPSPAAPPHAHRSDLAGHGLDNQRDQYGNPQREGMMDKMKDAVGVGPHSGTPGYDNRRDQPGYGTPGYDDYGQPRKEGMVDKMKDAAGMGPHSGTHPHDATHGPYTGQTQGVDYTNINRPSEERGFGGGLGHPHGTNTEYDQSHGLGSGLGSGHQRDGVHRAPGQIPEALGERRVEPGYDASRGQTYHGTTGGPRKEGIVEKIKDAVGMGKHDNTTSAYPGSATGTGYPHSRMGETGLGPHGNTTSTYGSTPSYSHNTMVDTGLGHERHPGSNTGFPHETVGERVKDTVGVGHHDAAGYPDNTTSAYPGSTTDYPRETMGDKVKDAVGVGHHDTTGYPRRDVTDTDYERRGKGFEETSGLMHDTKTGPGYDATRTGNTASDHDATRSGLGNDYDATRTGTGYDETNVGYPHNDANAYGVGGAPPKKGIMSKIKEKLQH